MSSFQIGVSTFCLLSVFCSLLLSVEASIESDGFALDFDSIMDQLLTVMKVSLACSPIILIGLVLAFAREDDETEAAKTNSKVRSCKS